MIVIDASALLEVLLNASASGRVAERLFAGNDTLHAPHVLDLEIAQVLRRYTLSGEMEAERGEQALEDLADLPLNRYPHDVFLFRIWALRRNLTAYDAAYVALAEALDAPLITRDAALARASGHRARVEIIR
ncbi:MAG: type II toxin-antitoxin system VapC family toxin [Candidatus Binatia bacterium]